MIFLRYTRRMKIPSHTLIPLLQSYFQSPNPPPPFKILCYTLKPCHQIPSYALNEFYQPLFLRPKPTLSAPFHTPTNLPFKPILDAIDILSYALIEFYQPPFLRPKPTISAPFHTPTNLPFKIPSCAPNQSYRRHFPRPNPTLSTSLHTP